MKQNLVAFAIVVGHVSAVFAGDSEVATDTTSTNRAPWRIVNCCNNSFVPDKNAGGVATVGEPPPLMITIEVDGTYPGLPRLQITDDFTFWDTVNNRKLDPYQVVVPRDIAVSIVGDKTKRLTVSVFLCDFVDNGFTRIFRGGYKPEWVAVSYKGGARLAMTQFAQKKEPQPSK